MHLNAMLGKLINENKLKIRKTIIALNPTLKAFSVYQVICDVIAGAWGKKF